MPDKDTQSEQEKILEAHSKIITNIDKALDALKAMEILRGIRVQLIREEMSIKEAFGLVTPQSSEIHRKIGHNQDMGYSDKEVDLKLENLEQRVDHKLDKVLFEVKEGFLKIENRFNTLEGRFNVVDTKLAHIDRLVWGIFIALVVILMGAAVKYLYERPAATPTASTAQVVTTPQDSKPAPAPQHR